MFSKRTNHPQPSIAQMFAQLIGQGGWTADSWPRSTKYLLFLFSVFSMFMLTYFYNVSAFFFLPKYKPYIQFKLQSVFFAFLVSVPYEKPIDSAADVLARTERVHICKGSFKTKHMSKLIC